MKAFPVNKYEGSWIDGMDLRDYFAAKAMQGVLASLNPNYPIHLEDFTEKAYAMADVMMEARKK